MIKGEDKESENRMGFICVGQGIGENKVYRDRNEIDIKEVDVIIHLLGYF